jgi:hypothetical protein
MTILAGQKVEIGGKGGDGLATLVRWPRIGKSSKSLRAPLKQPLKRALPMPVSTISPVAGTRARRLLSHSCREDYLACSAEAPPVALPELRLDQSSSDELGGGRGCAYRSTRWRSVQALPPHVGTVITYL